MATLRVFVAALRAEAPTGASFDRAEPAEPTQPWVCGKERAQGPTGRDSWGALVQCAKWDLAPLGLWRIGGRVTQGSAALHPGLSNLAPFGAFFQACAWNKNSESFVLKEFAFCTSQPPPSRGNRLRWAVRGLER